MGNITIFILFGAVVAALVACVKILLIFIAPSSKAAQMDGPEEDVQAMARRASAIKELQRRQTAARDPRHQSEQLVRQDPKGAADALRRMMKH